MIVDTHKPIPISNASFQKIIEALVFKCPSATVTSKKKVKPRTYINVSARGCSFRDRNITGTLLNTMSSQIKKAVDFYEKVDKSQCVENEFDTNPGIEKIVFRENSQMSDSEAVFYYIRNAFAHGAFEYENTTRLYKLESAKKGAVKAQMSLKEDTLKKLANLSAKSKTEIERLQKKKKH